MKVAATLYNLHYIDLISHSISSYLYALHRFSFLALNAFKATRYTVNQVFIDVTKLSRSERLGIAFFTLLVSLFDFYFE